MALSILKEMNILYQQPRIRRNDDLMLLRHLIRENKKATLFPYRLTVLASDGNTRDVWSCEIILQIKNDRMVATKIEREEKSILYEGESFLLAAERMKDALDNLRAQGWMGGKARSAQELAEEMRSYMTQVSRYRG